MTDYIEREKVLALQTVLHFDNIEQLKYWKCRHIDPIEVQLLPASDVRPVVHGEWVHFDGGFSDHYYCTACHKDIVLTGNWRFCPNCGADMRKELEND